MLIMDSLPALTLTSPSEPATERLITDLAILDF